MGRERPPCEAAALSWVGTMKENSYGPLAHVTPAGLGRHACPVYTQGYRHGIGVHSSSAEEVEKDGMKSGELEWRIDVLFDDVEGKVVETAEGPDGDRDGQRGGRGGILDKECDGARQAHDEEESGFQVHETWVLNVAEERLLPEGWSSWFIGR